MSYIVNGKKVKRVGVLLEPSTYDADITPVDMQHDKTAYVKGEKIVGTGKCFEYAEYGYSRVKEVKDQSGNVKYGLKIMTDKEINVLIISSMANGDYVAQTTFLLSKGETNQIGENLTAGGNIYAYSDGESFIIYFEKILSTKTKLLYFLGKDNEL